MVEGEEECHDKVVETAIEVTGKKRRASKISNIHLIGARGDLQHGARGGVQECDNQHPSGKHKLPLTVTFDTICFPQLVPQQECRQVPKEVCQTVFLNPRNVKVSLAFSMEGFASQCRAVPSPGHATGGTV